MSHASLAATAKRLIDKNGRTITLYLGNLTPVDTDKPWGPSDTDEDQTLTLKGVFMDRKESELSQFLLAMQQQTARHDTPRRGTQRFLVAALDISEVQSVARITDGLGNTWRVQETVTHCPADTPILHELEVAR